MGGKKRGGCFYNWIRSDLPDIEDSSTSVVLLAVRKSSPEQRPSPEEQSPVTSERHRRLLSQINERFRKTLSLDSQRSVSVQSQTRPKSMVQTPFVAQNNVKTIKDKDEELIKEKSPKKKRFRPKSFFSLETFLDSRRSEASSADDYSSSKYCKFYLESADSSPVFKGRATPDLLDTPGISSGESRCKKRLDKLENHYNKIQKLKGAGLQQNERDYEPNGYEGNIYSEPFYTSQTTLVLGAKPDSIDTIDKLYDRINYDRKECIGTVEEIANNSSDAILCEAQYINAEFGAQDRNDVAYVISVEENDVLMNERTKELVVKIMEKSVDSIGSCSLDVEADNTDFSDTTSGSLNILTPSSTGSHFRDFTSRLQERVGPVFNKQDLRPLVEEPIDQRKKPSYLHLACSVNGYSNITTYDSKLRQKLNKSREASPGRPGNTEDMLRDCTDDAMATRLNSSNSNNPNFFKSSFSESSISSQKMAKTNSTKQSVTTEMSTHTSRSFHLITNGSADIPASPSKSFIQQRVERLYGPGALAQGFFNQKRQKTKSQCEDEKVALNGGKVINHIKSPECLQLSRAHILKRSPNGTVCESTVTETYSNGENCDPALPVMRHLRPEFRAQLPMLSPKRSVPFRSTDNDFNISSDLDSSHSDSRLSGFDVVDRSAHGIKVDRLIKSPLAIERTKPVPHVTIVPIEREIDMHKIVPSVNGTLILNAEFAKLDVGVKAEEIKIDPVKINGVNKTTDVKIEDLDDNCNRVSVVNGSGAVGGLASAVEGASGGDAAESQVLDGHYFLELKKGETERLIRLAETAEKDLEELQKRGDASEEVLGFLRAAGGKARLLATQKMQQFEGLCHKNLNRRLDEPFPTTCTDLQGFWDMVSLQLVHIQQLFTQLEEMRAQGWTEVPTEVQPAEQARSTGSKGAKPRKPVSFKPADPAKAAATAKKRDEQRKALMQARRNLTANKTDNAQEAPIEIYAPPMRKDSEKSTSS